MEARAINIISKQDKNLKIKIIPGHFATSHSHINYYIDRQVFAELEAYAQEKGQTITTALERILSQFFEQRREEKDTEEE